MHLFTDYEAILSKLSEKGNLLERLDAVMDWTIYLPQFFFPDYLRYLVAKIKSLAVVVALILIIS